MDVTEKIHVQKKGGDLFLWDYIPTKLEVIVPTIYCLDLSNCTPEELRPGKGRDWHKRPHNHLTPQKTTIILFDHFSKSPGLVRAVGNVA